VLLRWSAAYNALLERWRHTWAEDGTGSGFSRNMWCFPFKIEIFPATMMIFPANIGTYHWTNWDVSIKIIKIWWFIYPYSAPRIDDHKVFFHQQSSFKYSYSPKKVEVEP
jgi:hypothetical protein